MRRFEFASIQVRDLEISKEFYIKKLGFELSEMENPGSVIFKHNKGEASFAIVKPRENLEGKELGTGVSIWFTTDEKIEDLETRFKENEVPIIGSVMQTPFGKALTVKDPNGYKLIFLGTE